MDLYSCCYWISCWSWKHWGFPYKAGTNGGGAFVLIYLLCIVMIGVPIMISEIIIGRRAGNSPINAMKRTALDSNTTSLWQFVGWSGITAGVLILSFYSVIAGICLNYIFIAASSGEILSSVSYTHLTLPTNREV